jgi:hypothetical protein
MNHDIFIFGSAVRGEVSRTSDVDVLVIPTSTPVPSAYPSNWSVYQRETIASYFQEGRLFAWHLHLESRCVYSAGPLNWLQSLGRPSPYIRAREDLSHLSSLLSDSLTQLREGTDSQIYELGLCYTALRDIAMAASWRALGAPSFSRYAPYRLPTQIPLDPEVYEHAMLARHFSTRGGLRPAAIEWASAALLDAPLVTWIDTLRDSL